MGNKKAEIKEKWRIGDKDYDKKGIMKLAKEHKKLGIKSAAVILAEGLGESKGVPPREPGKEEKAE